MSGGLKGMGRLPRDTVRARRNATQLASNFTSILGDGLTVDAGLIVVDLAASPGLEFSGGDLIAKVAAPIALDATGIHLDYTTGLTLDGTDLVVDDTVFVPYTGATANLDLGAHNLDTTGLGTFGSISLTGIGYDRIDISSPNGYQDINWNEGAVLKGRIRYYNSATGDAYDQLRISVGGVLDVLKLNSSGDVIGALNFVNAPTFPSYTVAGAHPIATYRIEKTTGGLAVEIFKLQAKDTTSNVTSTFGGMGFFGSMLADPAAPVIYYIYFGAKTGTAYNNALLKLDNLDRVGINIAGTTRPTEALQVNGNVHLLTDNQQILLGTGKDTGIYYDGSDLRIDSRLVGAGDTLISDGLTVNLDGFGQEHLTLNGYGPGGDLDARGGSVKWHRGSGYEGGTFISGYTYVNILNQFVWDTTAQATHADSGVAWVDFDDGSASFAGGNFDIDASGNITDVGYIQPASLADAAAPNNSIYYSTTQGKLVYKDSTGTVNNLY